MKMLLKKAQQDKALKLKDLAQKTGIDQALVSKYLSGKRLPSQPHVYKLAMALDLDYEQTMVAYLKTKILKDLGDNPYAVTALDQALQVLQESEAEYKSGKSQWPSTVAIDELRDQLSELRSLGSSKITDALQLEYTYQSNRIEGNTLTLKETQLIVSEGMTVSGKSMREHLEAVNHQEAIEYIQEAVTQKSQITERLIKELHFLVLKGIDPQNAGKYRSVQVMIQGSEHMPPQPYVVPIAMQNLMEWYEEHRAMMHPVVLAAEMHQRLVTIHPFIDGNGRTSRLLMNLILLQHGYVIANIKGDSRSRLEYYESLESSQSDTTKSDFIQLILDVELSCLQRYLSILGA